MIRRDVQKTISKCLLVSLLATTALGATGCSKDTGESKVSPGYSYDASEDASEMVSSNYTKVSATYTASKYTGDPVEIDISQNVTNLGDADLTSDTQGYKNDVVDLQLGDIITVSVDVPKTAQYCIKFDYLSYDTSILPVEVAFQVDGAYPFYETRSLKFETTWVSSGESLDRYGNEIATVPDKLIQWEQKYLMDSSYYRSQPLMLELTQGTHEFQFEVLEGTFLLGNITLEAETEVAAYAGSEVATGDAIIVVEAEDFTYRNDSSIHGLTEYDTSLTPYNTSKKEINTIDEASFNTAGQTISYEFPVEKDGYYYIGMNYSQTGKTDFPVFADIKIDGELPSDAFQSYPINYSSKYTDSTLTDSEGKKLSVYLTAGTHTISFTLSNDNLRHVLEGINEIMAGVNSLSLEITKVAGTNKDQYRDLQLTRYIPDVADRMYYWAEELRVLRDSLKQYAPGKDDLAVVSTLTIAADQLESLADEPDEIPYRVDELATSTNSANNYLANAIDNLLADNVAIDQIYIYQESAKLPSRPNVFQSLAMNASRFISSFFSQSYSASSADSTHLQVSVARSRQYVEILQKMIDEQFTAKTGIQVDVTMMPDQYKLVLANSSGSAPDVATGINYTIPYELALRGALTDLTQFEDFQEVASVYEDGLFITSTIGDSIYAMPETINFWVLFYRTDVLEKLGLEAPNTLQDVIDMLPELQMRGLNFYYPTAGMTGMRNFHGTTPLINQHGGYMYSDTAAQGCGLNSEASVEGFTALTELFTIYNLPVNCDSFYQHFRNGDYPIGIADYTAYNLISNAAPELEGSWEIALVPGVEQEDGEILRYTCGAAESTVIFSSNPEREAMAWEFVKWWSSTEVQAEFGQTVQIIYGDEYMWPTANMEAFMKLPWDSQDKQVIAEQTTWVYEAARVPGTYLMEREMSNAFNDIVVNGENLRSRLDEAVKTINREFDRKLEEFGYNDSEGNAIQEYYVPTLDRVKKLLGSED
ncbi:MAG: extracellular solute-binding protein [Lachnospiraceae bacterium]